MDTERGHPPKTVKIADCGWDVFRCSWTGPRIYEPVLPQPPPIRYQTLTQTSVTCVLQCVQVCGSVSVYWQLVASQVQIIRCCWKSNTTLLWTLACLPDGLKDHCFLWTFNYPQPTCCRTWKTNARQCNHLCCNRVLTTLSNELTRHSQKPIRKRRSAKRLARSPVPSSDWNLCQMSNSQDCWAGWHAPSFD